MCETSEAVCGSSYLRRHGGRRGGRRQRPLQIRNTIKTLTLKIFKLRRKAENWKAISGELDKLLNCFIVQLTEYIFIQIVRVVEKKPTCSFCFKDSDS